MKIKTYEDLAKVNAFIEPMQKKLNAKQKALVSAKKKVAKIEEDILNIEAEIEAVLNENNNND
jgi:predicted  nucleic acid-binding Zn-ribbon protein